MKPEKLPIEFLYQDAMKKIAEFESNEKKGESWQKVGELESYVSELEEKILRLKRNVSSSQAKLKAKWERVQELAKENQKLRNDDLIKEKNKEISRLRRRNSELVTELLSLKKELNH